MTIKSSQKSITKVHLDNNINSDGLIIRSESRQWR